MLNGPPTDFSSGMACQLQDSGGSAQRTPATQHQAPSIVYVGLSNYQYHLKVSLRYVILQLHKESGTRTRGTSESFTACVKCASMFIIALNCLFLVSRSLG